MSLHYKYFALRDRRQAFLRGALTVAALVLGAPSYAASVIGKLSWDYAYEDTGAACERYYSLYPPTLKCIKDKLYKVRYKISYVFHGQRREIFMEHIPAANTQLDEQGDPVPRNLTVKETY